MAKYLVKIKFDCNDADYVYGTQIIDEEEKQIIDRNQNKLVRFGGDFGETQRTVSESISVTEISEEEIKVLEKFGLEDFGTANEWWIGELDEADEDFDDYEEELCRYRLRGGGMVDANAEW